MSKDKAMVTHSSCFRGFFLGTSICPFVMTPVKTNQPITITHTAQR